MNQNGFSLLDLSVGAAISAAGVIVLSALVGNLSAAAVRSHEINNSVQSVNAALETITRVGRCAAKCVKQQVPANYDSQCLQWAQQSGVTLPSSFDALDCTVDYQKTGDIIAYPNVRFILKPIPGENCVSRALFLFRGDGQTPITSNTTSMHYPGVTNFRVCDSTDQKNGTCAIGSPQITSNSNRFFRFQLESSGTIYSKKAKLANPDTFSSYGGMKLESSFFSRTDGFGTETVLQCDPFAKNSGS